MAQLVEGAWRDTRPAAEEIGSDGRFARLDSTIRDAIEPDPAARFPAQAGRYHLFVAAGCPWAARTTAYRKLKGLEEIVSLTVTGSVFTERGWLFQHDTVAPFAAPHPLYRVYQQHDPRFTGKATVDIGYHYACKCNLRRVRDYPALSGYLRELYQWPSGHGSIAETVQLDEVKRNYWPLVDPGGPVPIGPELDFASPPGRDHLPGAGIFERPE